MAGFVPPGDRFSDLSRCIVLIFHASRLLDESAQKDQIREDGLASLTWLALANLTTILYFTISRCLNGLFRFNSTASPR
jgi:hypothetical protein